MTLRSLFLLSAATILGPLGASAEEILFCGTAPYYPSEYTCYDGHFLCPRLYGQATLPCGGACYSPDMYWCDGAQQLQLLPRMEQGTPFKIVVQSDVPALNNRQLEVCGLQFRAGPDAQTCVYCYNAPPQYVCSEYQNKTVLLPSGSMSVSVPGGQYWFVDQTNGRLRTTAAGKAAGEGLNLAGFGVTIYHEGYFSYDGTSHWLACREPGNAEVYGIFAPIPGSPEGCHRIKLATELSTVPKEGAYSYT